MNKTEMDFLLLDGITQLYLYKALVILEKQLVKQTKQRLKDNKVFLAVCCSPGSTIHNFQVPPLPERTKTHLVIIDLTVIKYCKFDDNEIAATILHEFGHILNVYNKLPNTKLSIETLKSGNQITIEEQRKEIILKTKEFYADYFVKINGFDKHLIRSLENYLISELPFALDKQVEIRERIAKIQSDEKFT